jgi:hypothetical protein
VDADMPMRLVNIPKFEKDNSIAINVIKYNEEQFLEIGVHDEEQAEDDDEQDVLESRQSECFHVVYRTKYPLFTTQVNLLLLENKDSFHYCAITNLNRLLNTDHDNNSRVWCDKCLRSFHRCRGAYEKHLPSCIESMAEPCRYEVPQKGSIMHFSDWSKTISPSFVAYCDFESLLSPGEGALLQTHMPLAAGCLMVENSNNHAKYSQFINNLHQNAVHQLLVHLEGEATRVKEWYDSNANCKMQDLTLHEAELFSKAESCYLCREQFQQDKVRDHDHMNGRYLGAACNKCNLARRIRKPFLPVVFHNLRGYDLHHILKHALSKFPKWSLSCIPQSTEKFLSLTCHIPNSVSLRFIDSLQFLSASLDSVSKTMNKEDFLLIRDLPLCDTIKFTKGIFPYSYMTDESRLKDTELPCLSQFYDTLTDSISITPEDYERAQTAWKTTNCHTMQDYLMLYLQLDCYLLADVFQHFRHVTLCEDKLDPLHFFSTPGLSWASAQLMSREEEDKVQLLHDSTMYEFFEQGIRGGMTFVNQHNVQHKEGETDLLYVDVNNLYGWALSQPLPTANFKWIFDEDELQSIVTDLPLVDAVTSKIGYYLEVDLEVPNELHDKLDQLPIAPEMRPPPNSKTPKLLLTHSPKSQYKIHFRLLQLYMSLGVKVTKVHRAIQFTQSPVFRRYIKYNTKQRKSAKSLFKKNLYKLKNNSLYGKMVENIRKRRNIRLCNTAKRLKCYTSKVAFKKSLLIDDNLVAVTLQKECIILDRPIFIGQAVLDISKLRMYQLQYDELESYRREFNCKLNIVAGDTDSFFLECRGVNLASQLLPAMKRDHLLDTSNYPTSHPLFSREHASDIGLIKDESGGVTAYKEWIFIRPKCYSLLSYDGENVRKAKGVSRDVVKRKLTHATYSSTHSNPEESRYEKQRRIDSRNHQLYTIESSKRVMGGDGGDDKRHWCDNNSSRAYGHYKNV